MVAFLLKIMLLVFITNVLNTYIQSNFICFFSSSLLASYLCFISHLIFLDCSLMTKVNSEPSWQESGVAFVQSVTRLFERLLDYRWEWIYEIPTMGHIVSVVDFAGAIILVPCHVVKSLQLIWRLGTRRWNLRVPHLQVSGSDLTSR